ncbi:MAG: Uma2 family endonuclease [Planctomycetaceae bacterium]
MTTLTIPELLERIEYPDSDGLPMSDNTLQWFWMVLIKEGLERLFLNDPNVFVAGNLLWYPVEGDNRLRIGPDVMVAFGRPKGYRGSYQQWREGNQPPQVVFEVVSPCNTLADILEKGDFYETYGVEEYYIFDPIRGTLRGYQRQESAWVAIPEMQNWISPRLQVRFQLVGCELVLIGPDGRQFVSLAETDQQRQEAEDRATRETIRAERAVAYADQEQARADHEQARADQALALAVQEQARADQEQARADQEQARADRLAQRLRALGIDPDQLK